MAEEVSSFPAFPPFLGLSKERRRSRVNNGTTGWEELPRNRGPASNSPQRFCQPRTITGVQPFPTTSLPAAGTGLPTLCLMTAGHHMALPLLCLRPSPANTTSQLRGAVRCVSYLRGPAHLAHSPVRLEAVFFQVCFHFGSSQPLTDGFQIRNLSSKRLITTYLLK